MCVDTPCAAGNDFAASLCLTLPNSDSSSLHRVFAAERTSICGVLGNLHLLYLFPKRGTVTRAILPYNTNLACAFTHDEEREIVAQGDKVDRSEGCECKDGGMCERKASEKVIGNRHCRRRSSAATEQSRILILK